jgi:hypothetical protein
MLELRRDDLQLFLIHYSFFVSVLYCYIWAILNLKSTPKMTPKLTPNLTPKNDSKLHSKKRLQTWWHLCITTHWTFGGKMYQIVAPKSAIERNPNLSPIKPLLVHRCITHLWIYTSMVGQTRMANENRTSELLWYCCNI